MDVKFTEAEFRYRFFVECAHQSLAFSVPIPFFRLQLFKILNEARSSLVDKANVVRSQEILRSTLDPILHG